MVRQSNLGFSHQKAVEQYLQATVHVLKQNRDGSQSPERSIESQRIFVPANTATLLLPVLQNHQQRRSFIVQIAEGQTLTDYVYIDSDSGVSNLSGISIQSENGQYDGGGEFDMKEVWAFCRNDIFLQVTETRE